MTAMTNMHKLGHCFQSLGRSLQTGGIGGYMLTDQVSPAVTGYLFVSGYVCVLIGEFLLDFTGEDADKNGTVPITIKPTDTPTKIV